MKADNLTGAHSMSNKLSYRIVAGTLLAAAALVTSMSSSAQQPSGSATTPPQATGQPRPQRPQILTQEERDQFRQRMQAAKTPEERAKVRDEMRVAVEQRAKEKGITLPQRSMHGGGWHQRADQGKSDGTKPDSTRQGARSPRRIIDQLFTKEEHDQFRKRMQDAKTPEERAKARDEMRKAIEQRAKEKGVELPKRPMRGPHGPRGAGDGASKDGSAPSATPPKP
jgi:hypothetical protein